VSAGRKGVAAASGLLTGLGAMLALANPAAALPNCNVPDPPPVCEPKPQPARPDLHVDGVQQTTSRSGVRVWGWTVDNDQPTTSLTVQFTIDGAAAGSATANRTRTDVPAAHPGAGTAHGYDVTLPASAAGHNVCVTAVNVGGGANAKTCRQMDDITGFEATAISYDVAHALISSPSLDQLDRVTNRNDTSVQQSTQISGSKTITHTEGWSQTTGVKVTVSTSFETGIPIIAHGQVNVSVEDSYSYTDNGSVARAQTFAWQQPVIVPPRSIVEATVTVTHATVTVPYTLTGNYVYRGGARAAGTLAGTFSGASSDDLQVSLTQYNLDGTHAVAPVPQPAAALLTAR